MLPDFFIRPATESDLDALDALIEQTRRWVVEKSPQQWKMPFAHEWVAARIADGEFFAVMMGGEMVGTFRLLWSDPDFWGEMDSPDAAYLHTLIVRRTLAGRGLGVQILRWAESYVAAHGRSKLRFDTLHDNERLIRFYRTANYETVGERGVRDFRVVLFEKRLTPPLPRQQ